MNAEKNFAKPRKPFGQNFDDDCFLHANNKAYEWVATKARNSKLKGDLESAIKYVEVAADFAASFHSGRFADGGIENILLDIGSALPTDSRAMQVRPLYGVGDPAKRRVLHVATQMISLGGHSRMLYRWVCRDRASAHSLVITCQGNKEIPSWLSDAIKTSGGKVVSLPADIPVCDKALLLRNSAHQYADLVVLHHDGHDAVPSLAFAKAGGPPVVVLNHADHHFWLGSSVADAVINLRSKACPHTVSRRFIDNNIVLPIPLDAMSDIKTRQAARDSLGIPRDQIMMLSIGRAIKYRPCGDYDFVATADRILQREPKAHIYVVGETAGGILPYLRSGLHDRLHFLGGVEDPSELRSAADIYLESFPFGSQTALLESALMTLPAVAAYAPLFELLVTQDDAIEDLLVNPSSEAEYVRRTLDLAADSDVRESFGKQLRERLLQAHVGDGWLECLQSVYQLTDKLSHYSKSLPICEIGYSSVDLCLSHWHVVPNGKDHVAVTEENVSSALACHSSYVARYVGDISASRRFAWKAAISNPIAKHSWRLLGISLLGKYREALRKVFAMP